MMELLMNGQQCKDCSLFDTRRVAARGMLEVALGFFLLFPYRCQHCCGRFLRFSPREIFSRDRVNRRELDRHEVTFDAIVANPARGRIPVRVADLSPEGFHCRSDETLSIGEIFDLSLYLLPDEAPIHVLGAVVRENMNNSYGLSFKQIGDAERHIVRRYISVVHS
ncbi:MAG: PilZ domain-containing protein [Gammaproteobacteria bacterium]|nr:PilZ domain-containing protein [Gammaproteobacteria bacterium]